MVGERVEFMCVVLEKVRKMKRETLWKVHNHRKVQLQIGALRQTIKWREGKEADIRMEGWRRFQIFSFLRNHSCLLTDFASVRYVLLLHKVRLTYSSMPKRILCYYEIS